MRVVVMERRVPVLQATARAWGVPTSDCRSNNARHLRRLIEAAYWRAVWSDNAQERRKAHALAEQRAAS